jgi:hypothetical protein
MEETKIIFDTAKLAKEKGFDLPTECGFEDGISTYCFHYREYGDVVHLDWNNETFRHKKERYSRPTQSLLQKWLREVYSINVIVETDNNGSKFYKVRIWENGNNNVGYFTSFTTYEEALEIGLQEALKLIK